MASFGITRVSSSLRAFQLMSQLQSHSMRLFEAEQRLATGRQLLSVSDDPITAEKIARANQSLQTQQQILNNLGFADSFLSATDSSIVELGDLINEARSIASAQASSTQSADERAAQAVAIDGIINQLLNIGNRQFRGIQLFGGRDTQRPPFDTSLGRVANLGDPGNRETLVTNTLTEPFNLVASELFRLNETVVGGFANFDVQLDASGRVNELGGASGAGVRLGTISITESAGPDINFTVDLTGVETVGDIMARFNDAAAAAGSTLSIGISPVDGAAFQITSGGGNAFQVDDVGTGLAAADLGIRKSAMAGATLDGDNVQRRVSLTTELADLVPGGLTITNGITVTLGATTRTFDFAGATTVQDVLNDLNGAGIGIRARINDAGDGIVVENLVAGTPLTIGENGGNDAETLGIKTIDSSVPLSRLNNRRGIHPVSGNDIRITDANGVAFEVDLTGATSVGDVIDAINAASTAAGSSIAASTNATGGGFQLSGAAGPGSITVESVNLSPVAQELGILKTGSATELAGDDVGAFYQSGLLTALYRLRDGLVTNDTVEISKAGAEIEAIQKEMIAVQGEVGARARSVRDRLERTESAVTATEVLLSNLRDVDFTEAISQFQQAQTALQASLLSGSQIANLSLLDFLR